MFPQPKRTVLLYIAGPYSAGNGRTVAENTYNASQVARKYWKLGYSVICPHTVTIGCEDAADYQGFLDGTLEMLRRCDAAVFMKNWHQSKGSILEHNWCRLAKLPTKYEVDERLLKILKGG